MLISLSLFCGCFDFARSMSSLHDHKNSKDLKKDSKKKESKKRTSSKQESNDDLKRAPFNSPLGQTSPTKRTRLNSVSKPVTVSKSDLATDLTSGSATDSVTNIVSAPSNKTTVATVTATATVMATTMVMEDNEFTLAHTQEQPAEFTPTSPTHSQEQPPTAPTSPTSHTSHTSANGEK
jgi:hypothetical protein